MMTITTMKMTTMTFALAACAACAAAPPSSAGQPPAGQSPSGQPASGQSPSGQSPPGQDVTGRTGRSNALAMALAWKQTAAEYEALYHQGFNLARAHVERALETRRRDPRRATLEPLAVISDLDDTVLDTRDYWRRLAADAVEFFDDARWDAWVATNQVRASPGARAFLEFCRDSGVEVFYVTSRDQGDQTLTLALGHLQAAGLPFADAAHLTVLRESSDKEPRQQALAREHEVIVYLGDNLNDFRRRYYVTDHEQRRALMEEDRAEFGRRFILFPNPTDGHWVRAIFGDSEPPPTPDNLARLHRVIGGK